MSRFVKLAPWVEPVMEWMTLGMSHHTYRMADGFRGSSSAPAGASLSLFTAMLARGGPTEFEHILSFVLKKVCKGEPHRLESMI
ncbi:hypothetical protein NKH28_20295 [Mesorhizobium sp. M1227]|uniref:hypothetical protein n=1 Tax=Mesorhizobium sp. M1227 TaxID=2957071 RepID=UPI00333D4A05